ncbi:MAG: hypothetical protein JSR17_10355 [Proteobacteria bacterium]|nr:hypothetical protein [Pseudomonadota bacterium]
MLRAFGLVTARSFSTFDNRRRVDFIYHRATQIKTVNNVTLYEYRISAFHDQSEIARDALTKYQKHIQNLGFPHSRIVIPDQSSLPFLQILVDPKNILEFLSKIGYDVNKQLNSIIDVEAQSIEPSVTKNKP